MSAIVLKWELTNVTYNKADNDMEATSKCT